MNITFDRYIFTFWLLTTGNRYEPVSFAVTETTDGLLARADNLTYGAGTGSTPGMLKVTFARHAHGFSWQAQAAHAEPIKGIKVAMEPLPIGPVMIPPATGFALKEGNSGRCFVYPGGYYPLRHVSGTGVEPHAGPRPDWAAQFVLLRDGDRTLYLHAREYPPRVKKLWIYHRGDHQQVYLYTEADACRRATEYTAPTWFLDEVGDWRQAVDDHAAWMADAFGLRPFAERADAQPWLKEVALTVILHGLTHDGKICHDFSAMTRRLEEVASLFPPQRTLVKLVGFDGRIDQGWPDNAPASALGGATAFSRLMTTAHRFGFRVVPHLNVWGASFGNPATPDLLAYQIQDSEGRPLTWSWDYDQDEVAEEIFAYISPDAPQWRAVLRGRVRELVQRYGMDAIYFDQTGTFVNDARYDHFRGLQTLYSEIRADLPGVQFTGEGPTTEVSVSVCPLLCGVTGSVGGDLAPEMYRRLFGPYVRQYGYTLPPEPYRGVWGMPFGDWWSAERFAAQQDHADQMGAIPTLNLADRRIRLDTELVAGVLDRARRNLDPTQTK